jgi:hypothetical protein
MKTANLEKSAQFYEALFGVPPSVVKSDYIKWMLDNPFANISLSKTTHGANAGVDHVGVQFDEADDMHAANIRLTNAETATQEEARAVCCYAKSDKYWSASPEGAVWELFHTYGENETYGEDNRAEIASNAAACCAPTV